MKYWSYIGTKYNTAGWLAEAVAKYGDIYINRNGGWMTKEEVRNIHETRFQEDFPNET